MKQELHSTGASSEDSGNVMSTVDIVERLYPHHDTVEICDAILQVVDRYAGTIERHQGGLSSEDVMLISYADQLKRPGEAPIRTLLNFCDQHFKGVINSVHLLPFFPYSSDDGFSVIDYYRVSPTSGSWGDIEAFSHSYKLMFDVVVNHMSSVSEWFLGYLDGDEKYRDFFVDGDDYHDLSAVVRPRVLPLISEFSATNGEQRKVWTTFSEDQVDLNYKNPRVLVQVLDVVLFYLSKGAKFLRLDAVGFLWKEDGSTCIHLENTHLVIQLIRQTVEELAPDTIIITETNVPHDENVSYFGRGSDEAHAVYNFALPPLIAFSILQADTSRLTAWASALSLPSNKVCFLNFTASHDGIGVRSVESILDKEEIYVLLDKAVTHGGNISYKSTGTVQKPYELNCTYIDLLTHPETAKEERAARFIASQSIAMSFPGIPAIYFHSLVGSTNYSSGVETTGQYRAINREKFSADILEQEFDREEGVRRIIFERMKKLLSIRKDQPGFDPLGQFFIHTLDPRLFVIERVTRAGEDPLYAIINVTKSAFNISLASHIHFDWNPNFDLVADRSVSVSNLDITPYQTLWLIQKSCSSGDVS